MLRIGRIGANACNEVRRLHRQHRAIGNTAARQLVDFIGRPALQRRLHRIGVGETAVERRRIPHEDQIERRRADPGPVAINVTADDRFAVISVEDSGPGLPDAMTQSVFTAFTHGSDDTGGTGLGLAVVRAIAEAHGGSAHYGVATGRGSRVETRLPLNP